MRMMLVAFLCMPFSVQADYRLENEVKVSDNGTNPAWSPDDRHITFEATVEDNKDIYLVEVETGIISRITSSPAIDQNPTWSPSGDKVTFISKRTDRWRLFIASVDGSAIEEVGEDVDGNLFWPRWSPTGESILVWSVSRHDGRNAMVSIDLESGEASEFVTGGLELEEGASWSPDGDQDVAVAFDRVNNKLRWLGMYLFSRNTRPRLVAMSDDDGIDLPIWMPQQSILYGSDPNGHHRLFVLDLMSYQHHEIQPPANRFNPGLSSDGQRLAYVLHGDELGGYGWLTWSIPYRQQSTTTRGVE